MTTFRRFLLAPCLGFLAGCAQQPSASGDSAPAANAPAVVLSPQPVAALAVPKPQPQPQQKAEPPAPPPTFTFPADLGGKAVEKALAPNVASPLSNKQSATTPQPRAVPAKLLEPEAVSLGGHTPPPLPSAKPAGTKPTNPFEKVPVNLGEGADGPPAKLVLPVAVVDTPRARDFNLPPPAPVLGRPATDRVPFDDPTTDLGNAVVASESVKSTLPSSNFVKTIVPDPFELGEQVKPKVPPTAEPSATPVEVNPLRVK